MTNLNEKDNIENVSSTLSSENKLILIVMIPFAVIFIIILIYFSIMLINKGNKFDQKIQIYRR